jgi:hypothetical protein
MLCHERITEKHNKLKYADVAKLLPFLKEEQLMTTDLRYSVSELLPKAFSILDEPKNPLWHERYSLNEVELYNRAIASIILIQEDNFSAIDTMEAGYIFSRAVLDDLVFLKANAIFSDRIYVLSYIKFVTTQIPLQLDVFNKRQLGAYNWVTYAFSDDLSTNQKKELDLNTILDFLTDKICQSIHDYGVIAQWLGDFYNMARSLAAIPQAGNELFQLSINVGMQALRCGSIEESFWCWMNTACWGANYDHPETKGLVKNIEAMVFDKKIPSSYKVNLVYSLTNVTSRFSTKSDFEWAKLALEDYQEHLQGHQKLAALLSISKEGLPESLDAYHHQVILEIANYNKGNGLKGLSKIEQLRSVDRLSEMLMPYVGTCIEYRKSGLAIITLLSWYSVNPEIGISPHTSLIFYPSDKDKFSVGYGGGNIVLSRDLIPLYKKLTSATNEFLGISLSINTIADFDITTHEVDRFGVPSEDRSEEVEILLKDFFHCEDIKELIVNDKLDIRSMLCLPSNHHSLQYISSKYIGKTWPLSSSLEKPKPDAEIKKVCLWCGAGSFTETMESNVLIEIFASVGIYVDYFSSEQTTKEAFSQIYASDDYDVIWLMSHGEFDHWNSGQISIEIGAGEKITLEEALSLEKPKSMSRRLLMLNVCDGATHTILDGLPKLGFAPALTSNQQCTISHLWPVNPYVAATFGAIYAEKLSKGNGFFEAFTETLIVLREPTGKVVDYLRNNVLNSNDIQERLNNNSINLELMVHSGSSAFFE